MQTPICDILFSEGVGRNMKYDVIIVGAGPAGLFAAYELITKKKDLKVFVTILIAFTLLINLIFMPNFL